MNHININSKQRIFLEHDHEKNTLLNKKLTFKTNEGYVFINPCDIIRIEACRNNTLLFVSFQKDPYKLLIGLTGIETGLHNEAFIYKCHRSRLINLSHIQEFKEKLRLLVTENGEVPISGLYVKEFKECWCAHNS